ncbi:MAG: serine/threonine protein kinase [Deltaproteobacteria bacterium]|nr:serine/threonine protein kinase [Deltaproteobacteria bacterium]
MSVRAPAHRLPTLEKYEILEELGHGGMATVYRARDARLGREVAVKLIHHHLRDNAEVRERFVAEARAVAKLRHPGIVDVYDVSDEADEERYLVVELIRGTTLRKVLDEHGALPPEVAAVVAAQLCEAVDHAHAAGVIHRDIKPENVLVDLALGSERPSAPREGLGGASARVRIKLTDFGIAKVLDAQGVTSTGQILGSPAHMAPEQIEGGVIAPMTDVFALGVLFYECLVGHLPFQGSNPAQVLRRVLGGDYEPADSERPEVGGRWAGIVAKALMLEPGQRYASAAEFGAAIGAELAALGAVDFSRCLDEFFDEPDDFRARHLDSLLPRLLERGEAARKEGDVHGAAADFNRALALAPGDLAILKRVSALGRRQTIERGATRVAVLAAGAIVLGSVSFAIARAVRAGRVVAAVAEAPRSSDAADRGAAPRDVASVLEPSAGLPSDPKGEGASRVAVDAASGPAPHGTASPRASGDAKRSSALRKVRVAVIPAGAKLRLDGVETSWFGRTFELAPGTHELVGFMPDGNACCSSTSVSVAVVEPPRNDPSQVQTFTVALGYNDARVTLSGGPAAARVTCDNGLVFGAGASVIAKMSDVQRSTTCTFAPGNRRQSITLNAGTSVAVPWPG